MVQDHVVSQFPFASFLLSPFLLLVITNPSSTVSVKARTLFKGILFLEFAVM